MSCEYVLKYDNRVGRTIELKSYEGGDFHLSVSGSKYTGVIQALLPREGAKQIYEFLKKRFECEPSKPEYNSSSSFIAPIYLSDLCRKISIGTVTHHGEKNTHFERHEPVNGENVVWMHIDNSRDNFLNENDLTTLNQWINGILRGFRRQRKEKNQELKCEIKKKEKQRDELNCEIKELTCKLEG